MSWVTRDDWQAEVGPVLGKPTALVTEDEAGTRERTARILGDMGFTVFRAGSIAEAEAGAERYPGRIDLLVTGPMLADGPGDRLVSRLNRLGFDPAILYVVPRQRVDLVPAGLSAPNTSVVTKPVTGRAISDEISALFALDAGVSRARRG